ncbi:hypothetical protein ElyMa_005956700 [Elysia marginata]|uniref:Reverse transcriptase/retrotransposon-derived protein RNase H-like domain-containing protein n=1 Tax=Elysia marginata TaxID=1093978 RepID=A0AAV4GBD0_9GAST|nr:hypothetical protein ElyMa_005956700 [Elysia marginata]
MLKKLTSDKPHTWDHMIPAVVFAYRGVPNTTIGVPPFTFMYGRQVHTSAYIVADICAGKDKTPEEFAFVLTHTKDMFTMIKETTQLAHKHSQTRLKQYIDAKQKPPAFWNFNKGDELVVLSRRDS